MKVRIKEDFTGYPDGDDKAPREFRAGQTLELDDDFAALIIRKGHAEEHAAPPNGGQALTAEDTAPATRS